MKQLSPRDRKKAMDVLAKCAAATRDIDDAEQLHKVAYGIFKDAFPNQPHMIERMCQSYNSAKSIHKLSTATDDSRGNDFSLLSPQKMYDQAMSESVTGTLGKVASAVGIKPVTFSVDRTGTMQKAASAVSCRQSENTKEDTVVPMSDIQIKRTVRDNLEGFCDCIVKTATAVNKAARSFEHAKTSFITKMASLHPSDRKSTAELLDAYYGSAGSAMVEAFNEANPLNKVASYNKKKYVGSVSLPNTEIYKKASEFVSASEELRKVRDRSLLMLDLTIPCIKDLSKSKGLSKEAAIAPAGLLGTALGVKATSAIPEVMELDDPSEAETRKKIYTTELENKIKEHSLRRAFMDMLLDDSIRKYPLDKILAAYNASLKETPLNMRGVPDTANLGLIKARTLAILGRGGVPSAGDADTIMNVQKVYGHVDPNTLIMQGAVEEA